MSADQHISNRGTDADFVDKWPRREKLYTESEHREAIAQAYERCALHLFELFKEFVGLEPFIGSQYQIMFDKLVAEIRQWATAARKGQG